jgi:hypothetical protein
MSYHLYDYNSDFDFMNQDLPGNNLLFIYGDQLNRIRIILKDRTPKQIYSALGTLDWMLVEGGREFDNAVRIRLEKGEDNIFVNRVKALTVYSDSFDITGQDSFPDATWGDYFALLSLAYILESLHPGNGIYKDEPMFEIQRFDWPLECMEAICLAECSNQKDELLGQTTVQKSGFKGGKKKASKHDEIRSKVIQFYEDNGFHRKTNRDAAKRIYKALKEEIDLVLNTDEPEKRLEKWIGQYKKGQLEVS